MAAREARMVQAGEGRAVKEAQRRGWWWVDGEGGMRVEEAWWGSDNREGRVETKDRRDNNKIIEEDNEKEKRKIGNCRYFNGFIY